jgi:DNA-binding transcriptional regulator LsrR (DeoR family)
MRLSDAERQAFWDAKPVGDIAARYYDEQGLSIRGAVDDRIVGASLEDLVAIPHVIGVAHGRAKAPGVLGALNGRLVDSLVCDESLARSVLSAARTSDEKRSTP